MSNSPDNRLTFKLFVILLVTVVCLGISFFQMTKGYAEFGGYVISAAISLVIVIILFYLSLEIHRAKKRGESYAQYFLVYLFFAALSFAGNYNGFYRGALTQELLDKELDQKVQKFEELHYNAKVAFREKKKITPQVEAWISDLEKQIVNDANGGCGQICKELLSKIGAALDRDVASQNFQNKDNTVLFEKYKRTIYGEPEEAFLDKLNTDIPLLKKDKEQLISPRAATTGNNANSNPDKSPSGQKETDEDSVNKKLGKIEEMVGLYRQRGLEAQALAVGSKPVFDNQLKVENKDIGKLKHTLDSVLANLNRPIIWGIAVVALMIDLFVPLFIIFITKNEGAKSFNLKKGDIEILESY